MSAEYTKVIAIIVAMGMSTAAYAADADEADLAMHFDVVDVWHFTVNYTVGYNNQDVIITRELSAQPAPKGKLCFVRFDLIKGEGDYSYGFKPAQLGSAHKDTEWGVFVGKRGTVLDQLRSTLQMNVIYFYVDGPKPEYKDAPDICSKKQSAETAEAGHGYKAKEWSDLIVRGKLIHGWPGQSPH
jgi:hypothetical protein